MRRARPELRGLTPARPNSESRWDFGLNFTVDLENETRLIDLLPKQVKRAPNAPWRWATTRMAFHNHCCESSRCAVHGMRRVLAIGRRFSLGAFESLGGPGLTRRDDRNTFVATKRSWSNADDDHSNSMAGWKRRRDGQDPSTGVFPFVRVAVIRRRRGCLSARAESEQERSRRARLHE
jgi:hypothetical protein